MVKTFTSSIIREIGRNYGKAISNQLLGDAHSTPYRRVDNRATLGSSSGDYKYANNLDRLIKKFEIKGALATFNAGQNIFNAFFELVNEAKADNTFDWQETIYLCEQYKRTVIVLNKISEALIELGNKEKQQIIAQKIVDASVFIDELNQVYKTIPAKKKQINKTYLHTYKITLVLAIASIISLFIGIDDGLDKSISVVLIVASILLLVLSINFKRRYNAKVNNEINRIKDLNLIKELVSNTAKIVSHTVTDVAT